VNAADAGVPDAPVDLLLEQAMSSTDGPFVRRLASDGSYWEYASSITTLDDGTLATRRVAPEWRRQSFDLTDRQVRRLRTLVERVFPALDAAYGPPGRVSDGYVVQWRADVDGHTVAVTLDSVDVADVDGLAEVSEAFELAVGQAAAAAGERDRG